MVEKVSEYVFFCFDTIHKRERRTDRQTNTAQQHRHSIIWQKWTIFRQL